MTSLFRPQTLYRILVAASLCGPAFATDPGAPPPPADAPPPPPLIEERPSDEPIAEPEVRIIRKPDETVEEYRIHGQLYMIRVTPKKGPPYYLLDADGNGSLETRSDELDPKIMIPGWVLFRW